MCIEPNPRHSLLRLTFQQKLAVGATHLSAQLGAAIRKVVTPLHHTTPSLEGQPVPVIEARLKEEEDDILKQLHTLDERLSAWQRADQS